MFGDYSAIAGYTPATDVTTHAAVDQDLEEILTLLTTSDDGDDPSDYTAAYLQYKNGSHSTKSSSPSGYRNFQAFGTADLTENMLKDLSSRRGAASAPVTPPDRREGGSASAVYSAERRAGGGHCQPETPEDVARHSAGGLVATVADAVR